MTLMSSPRGVACRHYKRQRHVYVISDVTSRDGGK